MLTELNENIPVEDAEVEQVCVCAWPSNTTHGRIFEEHAADEKRFAVLIVLAYPHTQTFAHPCTHLYAHKQT